MLVIKNWDTLSLKDKKECIKRPLQKAIDVDCVKKIICDVKEKGDEALYQYTKIFDKVTLSSLQVSSEEIVKASIPSKALNAIQTAIQNITTYHKALMPKNMQINTAKGISIERIFRPIDRVGLYIPGGNNTPLVSSILMQAIPALIAGCPLRILCTPPNSQGFIDSHVLVAARLCEIDTIFSIGGAQAIAAMAYGTETIPKVDKIFGPGNRFVTEAKTRISQDPLGAAIDIPAGPSEVMVIAEDTSNPAFVAADLLAQAEHGIDSQVFLIAQSVEFANKVNVQLMKQLQTLSRQAIIQQSLALSAILICNDREETLAIINEYAPEHLIINRKDANSWVKDIQNAGTIFLGEWAPETMGDYVTGSNHVLPTNGFARNHNGLSTRDFLKEISVQSITKEAIANVGINAQIIANIEGLDAHANAVTQRLLELEVGYERT